MALQSGAYTDRLIFLSMYANFFSFMINQYHQVFIQKKFMASFHYHYNVIQVNFTSIIIIIIIVHDQDLEAMSHCC